MHVLIVVDPLDPEISSILRQHAKAKVHIFQQARRENDSEDGLPVASAPRFQVMVTRLG